MMRYLGLTRERTPFWVAPIRLILTTHGCRFVRFGLVGGMGAVLNTALLYLLVHFGRWAYVPAAAVATEAAILGNFALNDRWTFHDARGRSPWPRRMARYNVVALGGLVVSLVVLALLTAMFHLHYLVANLMSIGAATLWNYTVNARFTWVAHRTDGPVAELVEAQAAWYRRVADVVTMKNNCQRESTPPHEQGSASVSRPALLPRVASPSRDKWPRDPGEATMTMQTLVIIPTYNERDNIGPLVRAVLAVDSALDVLVVDDNSPDGTGALADALAWETGRVRVLHRPGKGGLGTAYLAGFRDALDRGYARVVEMDADFSHRPEDLPSLLHAAETADVVVGSRNVPDGRVENWSPVRHAISKGGSLYARTVLGLPIKDCTGGFKCFRREALTALDLDGVRSTGFGFQVELNYLCHRAGLRIAEVPIVFPDRTRGASKMSGRIAAEAALMVLQLRLDTVYLLARKMGGVVLATLAIAVLFWLLYSYPALLLVAVPALLWAVNEISQRHIGIVGRGHRANVSPSD